MGALFSYERVIQMAKLKATRPQYLKEALKQEKRIKSFLRRATKRGYMFPENVMPKRPDVINKAYVDKLKELTPPSMYKEAHWVDPTTGEYVGAYEGRKTERRRAYQKGVERRRYRQRRQDTYAPPETPTGYESTLSTEDTFYADAVILNFKSILSKFNSKGAGVLSSWLDSLLFKFDKNDVATMLERGAQAGLIVTYDVIYAETLLRQYMADMVQYLSGLEPEDADFFGQQFYDALEEDDGFWTDT